MSDPDPIFSEFLNSLDEAPDNRSLEEVKAELREGGIDPETAIARLKSKIQGQFKEERLSWKKDVAAKKAMFQHGRSTTPSWQTAPEAEIETAYREYLTRDSAAESLVLAFRGKKELTLQDKAQLLDALKVLRNLPVTPTDPPT